jgi:uncharacterized protein YicC (UPF0701 family)
MPVYSMTGFATASAAPATEGEAHPVGVTVEMRTVNSRFLDIAFRLPDELRQIEPALRELLTAGLRRGKIEVRAQLGRGAEEAWPQPSTEQLNRLSRLESTGAELAAGRGGPVGAREPSSGAAAVAGSSSAGSMDELALQAARDALEALKSARAREGARLVAILAERIATLRALAAQAAPLVPAVVQKQQQRFMERWNEALASAGAGNAVSPRRRATGRSTKRQAFAIRIDVAEELSRLTSHLDEIERLLDKGGEAGKRLDFLIQGAAPRGQHARVPNRARSS